MYKGNWLFSDRRNLKGRGAGPDKTMTPDLTLKCFDKSLHLFVSLCTFILLYVALFSCISIGLLYDWILTCLLCRQSQSWSVHGWIIYQQDYLIYKLCFALCMYFKYVCNAINSFNHQFSFHNTHQSSKYFNTLLIPCEQNVLVSVKNEGKQIKSMCKSNSEKWLLWKGQSWKMISCEMCGRARSREGQRQKCHARILAFILWSLDWMRCFSECVPWRFPLQPLVAASWFSFPFLQWRGHTRPFGRHGSVRWRRDFFS